MTLLEAARIVARDMQEHSSFPRTPRETVEHVIRSYSVQNARTIFGDDEQLVVAYVTVIEASKGDLNAVLEQL